MLPGSFRLLPCCKPNDLALAFGIMLAALRNPGHILVYAPRISSFAALPQIEIYSVKGLCPGTGLSGIFFPHFQGFLHFFLNTLALQRREVVDKQLAVEMIDFVLEAARL